GLDRGADAVPRGRHADLAADLRQRRPWHRPHPRPRPRAGAARAGASRMSVFPRFPRALGACLCAAVLLLAGCRQAVPTALGTLEYDRIALPAPAAARIVELAVREGERVVACASRLCPAPAPRHAT